jgi:hypothetical protein
MSDLAPTKRRKFSDFFPSTPEDHWLLIELETTKLRLNAVERQLGLSKTKPLRPVSDIPGVKGLLRAIGLQLSDVEGYLASSDLIPRNTSDTMYTCPADNCLKSYSRSNNLHDYIRGSVGRGHRLLEDIIDQEVCPYCGVRLSKKGSILKHEQKVHNEIFESRLHKLLPHFGIYPREYAILAITVPPNLNTPVASLLQGHNGSFSLPRPKARDIHQRMGRDGLTVRWAVSSCVYQMLIYCSPWAALPI